MSSWTSHMGGVLFEQLQNQAFADEFSTIGGGVRRTSPHSVLSLWEGGISRPPHSRSTLTLREEDGEGTAAEAK